SSYLDPSTYPPPTHISTLSLHDALPISVTLPASNRGSGRTKSAARISVGAAAVQTSLNARMRALLRDAGVPITVRQLLILSAGRSEEHTSELQSRGHLVCRLLLEKKKKV